MASNLKPYADLKAKVGEYTNKDGETKGVYVDVGTLFASPHMTHMFIKIKSLPVGNWDGAVSVYKREDVEQIADKEEIDF